MLTVIGEALVDVVSRPGGEAVRHPGGSPFNVAVGLARLGHPVTFLGTWGEDDDGRLLEQSLSAEGIELPLDFDPDEATEIAEELLAAAEAAREIGEGAKPKSDKPRPKGPARR